MLFRAMVPKPIDDGPTEIVAADWLDPGLDALVRPVQPKLGRIAENRRIETAARIDFFCAAHAHVARFLALRKHSLLPKLFITAIVGCRGHGRLLSQRTFMVQGGGTCTRHTRIVVKSGSLLSLTYGPLHPIPLYAARSRESLPSLPSRRRSPPRPNPPPSPRSSTSCPTRRPCPCPMSPRSAWNSILCMVHRSPWNGTHCSRTPWTCSGSRPAQRNVKPAARLFRTM